MAIRWSETGKRHREAAKPILKYLKDNGLVDKNSTTTVYPYVTTYHYEDGTPYGRMLDGQKAVGNYSGGWCYKLPHSDFYCSRTSYSYRGGRNYQNKSYFKVTVIDESRCMVTTLETRTRATF